MIHALHAAVGLFAAWTLAFHFILIIRWPAWCILPCFAAIVVIFLYFRVLPRLCLRTFIVHRTTLIIALIAALLSFFTARHSADDATFFHRALVQAHAMDQPLLLTDTLHAADDLPAISPLHVATSYELLMALTARALHIDAVWFYQHVSLAAAIGLLVLVLARLYARLRLSSAVIPFAIAAALLFLVLDGATHRAPGVKTFMMMWQGRSILWGVGLPIALLFTLRYMARPRAERWLMLALCPIAGLGLSNAALYLVPLTIFAASLAHALAHRMRRRTLRRWVLANMALFYSAIIVAVLTVGPITMPDMQAWRQAGDASWWRNLLGNLTGEHDDMGRAALFASRYVIVAMLPLFALRRGVGAWLTIYMLLLIALLVNPFAGPWWISTLTPGAYWRIAYLFPFALCAGLIVPCLLRQRRAAVSMGLIALLMLVVTHRESAAAFKAPWTLRLDPSSVAFCRAMQEHLQDGNLLVDPQLARTLPLIVPSARLQMTRWTETTHLFRSAGRADEAVQRLLAQSILRNEPHPLHEQALRYAIARGLNGIAVRDEQAQRVQDILAHMPGAWQRLDTPYGRTLFIRSPAVPPDRSPPPH